MRLMQEIANRVGLAALGHVLGLIVLLAFIAHHSADPGLSPGTLEADNGLIKMSISQPGDERSLAYLDLPSGDKVQLHVAKAADALVVTVVEAPLSSEFARGQAFRLIYQGNRSRLFKCEGSCGSLSLLQS